jgi:hypothetical protein
MSEEAFVDVLPRTGEEASRVTGKKKMAKGKLIYAGIEPAIS